MLNLTMQINALMSAYSLYAHRPLGPAAGPARSSEVAPTKATPAARQPIVDALSFSSEAKALLESSEPVPTGGALADAQSFVAAASRSSQGNGSQPSIPQEGESSSASGKIDELTEEEQKQVESLQARDREVRQHEQAHVSAAGGYVTGGPTYSFQRGPDGKRYAVGGEVKIDTSPVEGDPEATAQKARIVRSAALAPAGPSSQDLRGAANATKMEQEALAQLRQFLSPTSSAASRSHSFDNAYSTTPPQQPRFLNVVA